MPWLEVTISVGRELVPVAEEGLEALGALAITLQDESDRPVLEPAAGSTPLWPEVRLSGLFDATVERQRIVDGLGTIPGLERPDRINWREVADRDWERAWMDRFQPMRFGRRLWIVPGGMSIPAEPENIQIRLDPGLAFGTGTHPTTALCLEWLDKYAPVPGLVVDYGCGSGVLALAAALLGARRVVCVDNDPQALEATAANAERNGASDRIACRSPQDFDETRVDVVLANILAGPLVALAPVLTGCTRVGGRIVLSGLLVEQQKEVAAAYASFCDVVGSASRDGWLRLDLQKL